VLFRPRGLAEAPKSGCSEDLPYSQSEVWRKSIESFEDGRSAARTVALFAEE
jgi:hypothetical protein